MARRTGTPLLDVVGGVVCDFWHCLRVVLYHSQSFRCRFWVDLEQCLQPNVIHSGFLKTSRRRSWFPLARFLPTPHWHFKRTRGARMALQAASICFATRSVFVHVIGHVGHFQASDSGGSFVRVGSICTRYQVRISFIRVPLAGLSPLRLHCRRKNKPSAKPLAALLRRRRILVAKLWSFPALLAKSQSIQMGRIV